MKELKWCLSASRHCSFASVDRCASPPFLTEIRPHDTAKVVGVQQDPWRPSDSSCREHALPSSSSKLDLEGKGRLLRDIRKYCRQGHLHGAVDALSILLSKGFIPHENVYWSVLKACSQHKALAPAKQVHAFLAKHGKGISISLLDYLVSTLAKCGGLDDALHLFHQLGPHRTVLSWSAVISAFAEDGKGCEALQTYRSMQDEGFLPNEYTIVSLLKACGNIPDCKNGMELHSYASMKGLDTHEFVASAVLTMYGKCGHLDEAERVFDNLSKNNVVLWNAMFSAYAEQDEGEKIWLLYDKLVAEGMEPNERTFVILIQACCMLAEKEESVMVDRKLIKPKSLAAGKRLHADAQCKGLMANVFVSNILVSMFGKCGSIADAESVFWKMSDHTVVSWTAMLWAYNEQDQAEMALQLFSKLPRDLVSPNEWTYTNAIQACCLLAEREEFLSVQGWKTKDLPLDIGRSLHADARKKGYDVDASVGYMLVNLYGKCGSIHEAVSAFNVLPNHSVGLWNALLSAYIEQKAGDTVLHLYRVMQEKGVIPDEQTSIIALQACSALAVKEEAVFVLGRSIKKVSLDIGRALHADAQKMGFELDIFLGSILVSMYGKCGSVVDAENVFDGLTNCDVVSWTAMLSAYGEQGLVEKVIDLYHKMQDKDVILDDGTLVSLVQACRDTGTLELCKQIHFDIVAVKEGASLLLTTAFIHAYACCASMVDALAVFDSLLEPDVVSWSALIAGHAKDASYASSFATFECMKQAGIEPNEVTFLSLLSACGHAGLITKGVEFFESMSKDHGIMPKIDHFVAVVDLLGRSGDLETAEDMLLRLPEQPDLAMWLCLLDACRKHGNLPLGERVFKRAVLLHPDKASAYVMMSNIYSDAGLWDYASEIDRFRHKESAWKKPVR